MKSRTRQQAPAKRRVQASAEQPSTESSSGVEYPMTLVREEIGEEPWLASVDALPGCVARGATPDEAVERAALAVAEWTETAKREGREVPEPKSLQSHSGRLLLRMPQTLHAELSRAAERENVSLNQFITDVLAGALGWRAPGRRAPATRAVPAVEGGELEPGPIRETARTGAHKRRVLSAIFVANGVIIALAAVVAVAVLIAALR